MNYLQLPLSQQDIDSLSAGDAVALSGEIYTARDAAHKRLAEMIDAGEKLPIDIEGQTVYYAGPCPAPPGKTIGSVGPTTSKRMDAYAPKLMQAGLRFMIGKGERSREVTGAIKQTKGIYFTAIGGAGAYYAGRVLSSELVAFEDLGPEAIYKLTVKDFPVIVAIDKKGNSIYK